MMTSQQLHGFLYCLENSKNLHILSDHNLLFSKGNYSFFLSPESDPEAIWIEGDSSILVVDTFPGDVEDSGRLKVLEVDRYQSDAAYVRVQISK